MSLTDRSFDFDTPTVEYLIMRKLQHLLYSNFTNVQSWSWYLTCMQKFRYSYTLSHLKNLLSSTWALFVFGTKLCDILNMETFSPALWALLHNIFQTTLNKFVVSKMWAAHVKRYILVSTGWFHKTSLIPKVSFCSLCNLVAFWIYKISVGIQIFFLFKKNV